MIITWKISPDGGLTWVTPAVATSTDQTFVTLTDPVGAGAVRLTVLYAGTEGPGGGNGATDNASLLSMVWSGFTGLHITRADGTLLQYWGGCNATAFTSANLISSGNGQCYSWASLFVDCLTAWGDTDAITKKVISAPGTVQYGVVPTIAPVGGGSFNYLLVGSWNLSAEGYIPPNNVDILNGWTNYALVPTVADDPNNANIIANNPNIANQPQWIGSSGGYIWTGGPPYTSPPAQNNPNPKADFQNHMVVLINGVLYDPSYGVTYAYDPTSQATQLAGFAANLGGLMVVIPFNNRQFNFDLNGTGINNNTSYWVALFKPINVSMLQMN